MTAHYFTLLIYLVGGHFLCDFPLQGEFMSQAKNPFKRMEGVPAKMILFGHSSIHCAMVTYLTGLWYLGIIELISHCIIDYTKCKGLISFQTDQFLHLEFKVVYVGIVMVVSQSV